MAKTNLSLTALAAAMGTDSNINSCAGKVIEGISLTDFAVGEFSSPYSKEYDANGVLYGNSDPKTFTLTGSDIGDYYPRLFKRSTANQFTISFSDPAATGCFMGVDDYLGMIFCPYTDDDCTMTISYLIADGFNVNATNYNTWISREFPLASGCFLSGMKITMANGILKPIELVKTGEYVISRDFNSNLYLPKKVERTLKHTAKEYWIINNKLCVTPNHKVWINDVLSTISELKIGDYLRNEVYEKVWIFDIKKEKTITEFNTYNLKIEDTHNYVCEGLLVHNKCPFLYSITNDGERFETTVLTEIDKEYKRITMEYSLKYNSNRYVIREIEPETSHIYDVRLKVEIDGEIIELFPEEDIEYPIILKQGNYKYFNFPKLDDRSKNVKFVINGYYISD